MLNSFNIIKNYFGKIFIQIVNIKQCLVSASNSFVRLKCRVRLQVNNVASGQQQCNNFKRIAQPGSALCHIHCCTLLVKLSCFESK